ncbi:hypothetical protein BC835DRAFT_1420538 [Cytidiella melzeri]|nr:hypothetical protein BC835DRAFT_1420538 [Cytidiella melzeri]
MSTTASPGPLQGSISSARKTASGQRTTLKGVTERHFKQQQVKRAKNVLVHSTKVVKTAILYPRAFSDEPASNALDNNATQDAFALGTSAGSPAQLTGPPSLATASVVSAEEDFEMAGEAQAENVLQQNVNYTSAESHEYTTGLGEVEGRTQIGPPRLPSLSLSLSSESEHAASWYGFSESSHSSTTENESEYDMDQVDKDAPQAEPQSPAEYSEGDRTSSSPSTVRETSFRHHRGSNTSSKAPGSVDSRPLRARNNRYAYSPLMALKGIKLTGECIIQWQSHPSNMWSSDDSVMNSPKDTDAERSTTELDNELAALNGTADPDAPATKHDIGVCTNIFVDLIPPSKRKQAPNYRLSQAAHRSPTAVAFRFADVREEAKNFLGRKTRLDPFKPNPTRQEKAAAKRGVGGPDPDNPRLDSSIRGVAEAVSSDRREVEAAFLAHVPALCKQARKQDPDVHEDMNAVSRNRRRVRRRKLGKTRWETTFVMTELKHISKWINRLGTDGNSDDESDGDDDSTGHQNRGATYWIVPLQWRSDDLVNMLRVLDVLHVSTRFNPEGKPDPGNWPRIRRERQSSASNPHAVQAVPRLPRNFYSQLWLDALTDQEFDRLEIRSEEVDLSIPGNVEQFKFDLFD